MRRFVICFWMVICCSIICAMESCSNASKQNIEVKEEHDSLENDSIQNLSIQITQLRSEIDRINGLRYILVVLFALLIMTLWYIYKTLSMRINEQQAKIREEHHKKPANDLDNRIELLVNKKIKPLQEKIKTDLFKELKGEKAIDKDCCERKDSDSFFSHNTLQKAADTNCKAIYAKPLKDGRLKATSEITEAIYVIYYEDMPIGEFKLFDNQEQMQKAIRNREDCLDGFCEIRGSSVGAKEVRTLTQGKAEQKGNNIWEVVKKVEIEFVK